MTGAMEITTDRRPPPLAEALERLEENEALDQTADALARAANAAVPRGPVRDALTGAWLGHAVHPMLTDIPIGCWTSASILDVLGGRSSRKAATLLLALGNAAAFPTIATGLAEWLEAEPAARRVGFVHAGANAAGLACYSASLLARLRGRHLRGAAWALAGMGAATVGGLLGGHMAFGMKVGSRHPADTPR
jgi:uncharacterized membrane protein